MTRDEFKAIRRAIGWNQTELGKILDKRVNTVSRYETGELEIPQLVEIFMLLVREKKNQRFVEKYL
jgi:transcriptional regulator with XRE-family HTH domain